MNKIFDSASIAIVVLFSILPLFSDLSYQINLYLTWEGAYRIFEGQVPFRDFGIPMGPCYWIIPALFFKIFGTSLITLAKAQVFINIISGISFYWIMRSLGISNEIKISGLLVYCFSFILGLYWPQYNHTVIVFQFLAIAIMLHGLLHSNTKIQIIFLSLSGAVFTISFFTKQDAGAMGILIGTFLTLYYSIVTRKYYLIGVFFTSLGISFALFIIPFLKYDFGYWLPVSLR